jgi:uncharacterized protein (DUF1810 family)
MASSDPHDLNRFVEAQKGVVEAVKRELAAGRKQSHWMWFVFPQVRGLGTSPMAQRYAIRSLEEARAYLEHPVLGPRLIEWTHIVLGVEGRSAEQIFGYPDYLKFRSSMTLFSRVPGADPVFARALEKYYRGEPDRRTLEILGVS